MQTIPTFRVKTRIECSGESKFMHQLADLADSHGAKLHAWETGQYGPCHPVYIAPSDKSGAFIDAVRAVGFSTSPAGIEI